MRASIQRDTLPLLLALYDRKLTARRLSNVVEKGRTLIPVEVTLPTASPVTLYFDDETALLSAMRYEAPGQPTGTVRVAETYSDYRDVKGLQVAFKTSMRRERAPNVDRVLGTFEVNAALDPAIFLKPR